MVADFEYNSGFELLAERLSNTRSKTESSPSTFSIACIPKLQNSTVLSSMAIDTSWFRHIESRVARVEHLSKGGQPCAPGHRFGNEAMEQLDHGQRGKYVNVAEAKVIVEAIGSRIFLQFLILKIAIGRLPSFHSTKRRQTQFNAHFA